MKWSTIYVAIFLFLFFPSYSQQFMLLNDQFIALYQQGKYAAAIPVGEKAIAQAKIEFGTRHLNYAIAADNLANAHFQLQSWQPSLRYFHLAKQTYVDVTNSTDILEVGNCDNMLGTIHYRTQHYDSALVYYTLAYRYFSQYPEDQYDNLVLVATNLSVTLNLLGDDASLEEVTNTVVPIIAKTKGIDNDDYVLLMRLKGEAQRNQQKLEPALQSYELLRAAVEKRYGRQHAEYAAVLDNMGDCMRCLNRFDTAFQYFGEASSIRNSLPLPDSLGIASHQHYLANLYGDLSNYERAEALYDSSLAMLEALHLQQEITYTTVLRSKAYTYVEAGKHTAAKSSLRQLLQLYETQFGKNYSTNGEVLITLANTEYQTNELANASNHLKKGVEIVKLHYGNDNYLIARSLEIQGLIAHKTGKSHEGLALCDSALAMTNRMLGEKNQYAASVLSNIGVINAETGDYPAAEAALRKSFTIRRDLFGVNHAGTAISMNNLAIIMIYQSRFEDADKLLAAAFEIYRSKGMLFTINGLNTINNIAMLVQKQDDYEKAEQLYKRVLELMKADSVQNKSVYGNVYNNLATNALAMKKYDQSLQYATLAMEMAKANEGEESLTYLRAANNCMVAEIRLNHFDKAIELGNALEQLTRKMLGDSAEMLIPLYSNLSSVEAKAGKHAAAIGHLQSSLSICLRHYEKNLYALSEKDQVSYWQQQSYLFQLFPSLLLATKHPTPAAISDMVNQQLRMKGFVLNNATATMQKARQIKDPELQLIIDQWQAARTLYLQQSGIPINQRLYSVDSLAIIANNSEQAINRKTGREILASQPTVTWQQVQHKLAADEAAVEFIRYPRFVNNTYTDTVCYAAIVIRKQGAPDLVPLSQESNIRWCMTGGKTDSRETNISKLYRSNIKGKVNNSPTFTGDTLYQLVWKPLQPFLTGIKQVSFAPDGLLHKLSFAALPISENVLLIDSFRLQQYSSIRQLSERTEKAPTLKSAVLEGFANFGQSADGTTAAWSPLPGTKMELDTLQQLFAQHKLKHQAYLSNKATEESLKNLSNQAPSLLHIATHGFFLSDLPASKEVAISPNETEAAAPAQNPLMRSGIVLAGANLYWRGAQVASGKDDGIVTAYEIAQLNLNGTELAVLSACETGLGDVQDSEGVFGLQRALKMAGVRNMVLSLWQVPDEETKELMIHFYQAMLNGDPVRTAFDKARRTMRSKYPPFAWAAFVLVE